MGLFKTSTTMALLQKIGKTCPSAAEVLKVLDNDNRRNTESTNLFSFSKYDDLIFYIRKVKGT